jgi:hypothetical protein
MKKITISDLDPGLRAGIIEGIAGRALAQRLMAELVEIKASTSGRDPEEVFQEYMQLYQNVFDESLHEFFDAYYPHLPRPTPKRSK